MDAVTAYRRRADVDFLDVREQDEWDAGRIEGAKHIPLAELPARLAELPRDRPIVAVCKVGGRSEYAARFLSAGGFEVENLDGGVVSWVAAGLPFSGVVKSPRKPA